ncbi:MAG: hypothetical protein AVDCRST_MAG78-3306 [uncultured Rubrobacteraceae bacterium]|uniref:LysR substrate-binding domain-containing protein n=1 Tax=uncultured Rubrobacteraceae bacterium TaxID=349277 RepID=A0A6J4QUM4_9ACTN|nr:MAG: hypothetical protein AVDCRST_MAG78-3306 [uncultured Rubrobacteraceae bacterium]
MQTIVGLVAGGTGVTLVPASLRNLRRKGVAYKSVHGLSPTVELGVIWRPDDPRVVLDSFLRVTREGFRGEARWTSISRKDIGRSATSPNEHSGRWLARST